MSQDLHSDGAPDRLRTFTRAVLEDLRALGRMIDEGRIESGVRRIGAEQELFLVDGALDPALTALEVLERTGSSRVTTELARFNLEFNLSPRPFAGDCMRRMEDEIRELLHRTRAAAEQSGTRVLLTGILPTLRKRHLTLDSMTPFPRYAELNRATTEHRGGEFRMHIKGLDELNVTHDNVLFEACNTSFQIHFQVGAEEFCALYNLAQAITGPVLAAAVNSPVLLQHRLWHETRMALFQQSVDSRPAAHHKRFIRPRVIFGDAWIEGSVMQLFREDISRFRIFLAGEIDESPMEALDRGEVPSLSALRRHNGTVYRWNRPCYGVSDGVPHLRIEHRVLPSGPSVVDEMANAAFFFGLMSSLSEEHGDIARVLDFDDAKYNFTAAARYGLTARLRWIGGRPFAADTLILEHLLPRAREGLAARDIDSADATRYLDVIEERVRRGRTGAQWMLDSLAAIGPEIRPEQRFRTLTASLHERQLRDTPVHTWTLASPDDVGDWRDSCRTVAQFMTTDLVTVGPDDLVELVASMMEWQHVRHVAVEDRAGKLVGLVSHTRLLRLLNRGHLHRADPVAVREVMVSNLVTVGPDTPTLEAIRIIRHHRIGCVPVVDGEGRLLGLVSERDFMHLSARLLDETMGEG